MSDNCLLLSNASARPLSEIPVVDFSEFADWNQKKLNADCRVCALLAVPGQGGARLYSILADDAASSLAVLATDVGAEYPSLTPQIPAMHLFEREIFEQQAITPLGHPWLKPVRFEAPGAEVGVMDFFRVDGDDVHEVAVGPIHAGIIECGHFRFQCQGEVVIHLEISLGYHHRGVEQACRGPLSAKTLALMETLAGDSTIGHSWAYCSNIESLTQTEVPLKAQLIRVLALELERLANHTGDLGALGGDIGYLPTASFCGRLRGDYLNLTAAICGNRFGRGLLTPGGVRQDVNVERAAEMQRKLQATAKDTLGAVKLLWTTDSVTARMLGRGVLQKAQVLELGLVGPAARASGLDVDARNSHPLPHLTKHDTGMQLCKDGDVYARAKIREKEIKESVALIKRIFGQIPGKNDSADSLQSECGSATLLPDHIAVSLVEGWRGEICHIAITDNAGGIGTYKIVDPSFHNWLGLAIAMRLQQISDFPLCNKSFNLSYCGHDL